MNNSETSSAERNAVLTEHLRRNPNDVFAWATRHRTIGGAQLMHLPAIADMLLDTHPFVVVMKSAQVGVSEGLVNVALHAADTGYADRGNVLFAMPTQNQVSDFVQARVDPAIQQSAYLRGRLSPEPPARRGADSTRLKSLGVGHIYFRGTDSKRQLASMDVDVVILDEYDQMPEGTLALARKRTASSRSGRIVLASTPRFPEAGIHGAYLGSDQRRYFIACRHCGLQQPLDWPENIDMHHAQIVCRACRKRIDGNSEGQWRATNIASNGAHGYALSRLYSPWANISAMIEASESASSFELQEFHNSDLGVPFVPPGGGLNITELDAARDDYGLSEYDGGECVAGIDVGVRQHIVIREAADRELHGTVPPHRLWFADAVSWEELPVLFKRFNVTTAVIDGAPETFQAQQLANKTETKVILAQYTVHAGEHEPPDNSSPRYRLNRTLAIDETMAAVRGGLLALPQNARELGGRLKEGFGEYYRQLMAPQRVIEAGTNGVQQARWRDRSKADHFAHAEVYCFAADRLKPRSLWTDELFRSGTEPGIFDFRNFR